MSSAEAYCFFGVPGTGNLKSESSDLRMSSKMADEKHNHDACEDESDFDEEYFSRTYQPLSNLPTPPPSCRDSISSLSPRGRIERDELLESALLGTLRPISCGSRTQLANTSSTY